MYNSTTDLKDLKSDPSQFTWGKIIEIQSIGPYTVAKFHPWKTNGMTAKVGIADYDVTEFHCWIDGKDASRSADSLEEALAICMAIKHDGVNTQAHTMFMRMIGKK